jgi:hypothetical protein
LSLKIAEMPSEDWSMPTTSRFSVIEQVELYASGDGELVSIEIEERERVRSSRALFGWVGLIRGLAFALGECEFRVGPIRCVTVKGESAIATCLSTRAFGQSFEQSPFGPEFSVFFAENGIFVFRPGLVDECRAEIVGPPLATVPGGPSQNPLY